MNTLIVGSGGREHVLAYKLAQSDRVSQVFAAPGNAGTAMVGQNVDIAAEDIDGLLAFARAQDIGLTVVGPEDPLCAGIVDRFAQADLKIFGPCAAAARLEGDKTWSKQLMRQAAIPTADGRVFASYDQARDYVATRDTGLAVKAAGLAKGKGVFVCEEPSDALLALEDIMVKKIFGAAGEKVVVEEKLTGPEVSIHALVDGRTIYILETSQDHKPVGDGDTGPNTGGMGAYSPADVLDEATMQEIYGEVLVPVVDALNRQDTPYKGVLYAGMILTAGGPKVLEFNCRFGDPEAQVILPRLQTDFVDIALAVIDGQLEDMALDWDPRCCVCVVLASSGYPGSYEKGKAITGLEEVARLEDVLTFHAGTTRLGDNVLTSGGRVLGVTALGDTIQEARDRAYDAAGSISFEGAFCRRDIAHQALNKS